jgi:hypothetical protein
MNSGYGTVEQIIDMCPQCTHRCAATGSVRRGGRKWSLRRGSRRRDYGRRSGSQCGSEVCRGNDACKDDSNIGRDCPTGTGSFCQIKCVGKAACSGNAKFKPASESGHIICNGEDTCKDARVQLQGNADATKWKLTCTGSNACGGNFNAGGVGYCSGGACPTCSTYTTTDDCQCDEYRNGASVAEQG